MFTTGPRNRGVGALWGVRAAGERMDCSSGPSEWSGGTGPVRWAVALAAGSVMIACRGAARRAVPLAAETNGW